MTIFVQQRIERCAYVPLLADNLLPNADLATPGAVPDIPHGWVAGAPGVRLGDFAVDGDGRALQLIGIANYVQTPPISVETGRSYCFDGLAITDAANRGSATRLQVTFHWYNAAKHEIAVNATTWQPATLWQPNNPPERWSSISAAFQAPPKATELLIRIHPASDDRVYLDAMHVRAGGQPPVTNSEHVVDSDATQPSLAPWPNGKRAAVAFTFDWETTMSGLIHSRSVDDPNFTKDPVQRGLRMREGITTTLALFQPYNIRATYYATGYNFLMGNTARTQYMDNPTYAWASTENRWTSDRWQTTPWFADDPYGTVASHPAWYFGDLTPLLQRTNQDIQSHTFSHFYGGFVNAHDWQADFAAWKQVAAERSVPPARSLAFPWSGSGGMSDASWDMLESAGITSVTRLSDQSQYNLFPRDASGLIADPRCRPLPGHERILACPDFYLTPQTAEQAIAQIDAARAVGGMIDLWAHTEEVTSPEQIEAWQRVIDYVAGQPDVWIAPLSEIADWQQALEHAHITIIEPTADANPLAFRVTNNGQRDLNRLALTLPFLPTRLTVDGDERGAALSDPPTLIVDLRAGQTMEVELWPKL